ncbi:MAG: alpha-amylase/4-alpha-glucanotransferase domain-containing protein [Halarcobacter sp.]
MKTSLLFGIHCHQPIDNFDRVVYEIIEKSYKPFFNILKLYPKFKCSVHFSGWLFEFIEKNDTELFNLIKELSPQIEFFTGGYYEPILASIPSKSRVEQINKLSSFIQKNFNQKPRGLWLTERIWDDSIIDDLNHCNIDYVIVDDYHLIAAGFDKNSLKGYFITENSNNNLALFPINKDLRYIIPFAPINETMEKLNSFANEDGKNAAIIFDDGEKFGVWPKTYEKVYEKEWLKNFFQKCIDDESIEVSTFSEYYNKNKALGLSYLPTVSYHEMGEWSALPSISKEYHELVEKNMQHEHLIRGGIWKNFFLKYDESNWIHKRSLELSKMENQNIAFKESLYKTQCNDVLWHGVFGGIYLPNLRDNAFKYIINCENILSQESGYQKKDINFDTYFEYKYYTKELITIIDTRKGAQIVELDLRDCCFNLQNTLTRYHETYHDKIVKMTETTDEIKEQEDETIETIHNSVLSTDEDIELYVDWYSKKSAIDHICDNSLSIDAFKTCGFQEYGDFANQEFELVESTNNKLVLKREGGIYKDRKYDTTLEKSYEFNGNQIDAVVSLQTQDESLQKYLLEWNLHFEDYKALNINGHDIEEDLILENSRLTIMDRSLDKTIEFQFDQCMQIYISKVKSVSQSEEGVDYTTQGLAFGFIGKFSGKYDLKYSINII